MRALDRKNFLVNLIEQFGLETEQVANVLSVDVKVVDSWIDFLGDESPSEDQIKLLQRKVATKPVRELVCRDAKAVQELEQIQSEMVKAGETSWLSRISSVINLLA